MISTDPLPLGLPKSTYYRWLKRQEQARLQGKKGGSPLPWNKLRPEEEAKILSRARVSPELSSRQLALHLVDEERWYVLESTAFRILKREGLIKPAEVVGFKIPPDTNRQVRVIGMKKKSSYMSALISHTTVYMSPVT